jgi:hypothetical protein
MGDYSKHNIAEITGRKPPTPYNSKHGTLTMASPATVVGLELEIENFTINKEHVFGGFTFTTDGSLRNNGIEAITKPVMMAHVPPLLEAFYKHFGVTQDNYSERCSTHVHMNVLDMTVEQLGTLSLLYQTLERLLFAFISNNRGMNIFCVPWYQSSINYTLVTKMFADPHYTLRRWQKYSALNFLPVYEQGSIEFRHLYGTCDVKLITSWLNILGRMRNYATTFSLDHLKKHLLNMNTISNYNSWLDEVFLQDAYLLKQFRDFEGELSLGVVDSKAMLYGSSEKKESLLERLIRRQQEENQQIIAAQREIAAQTAQAPLNPWNFTAVDQGLAVRQGMAAQNTVVVAGTAGQGNWVQQAAQLQPLEHWPEPQDFGFPDDDDNNF